MVELKKMTSREISEQEKQNRREIAEGRSFGYLVIFTKLVFVCIEILSLLIVKSFSLIVVVIAT